jgi:hypothetical protein
VCVCELAKGVGRTNDRGFRTCLLENFMLKSDYTLSKMPKAPADSSHFLLHSQNSLFLGHELVVDTIWNMIDKLTNCDMILTWYFNRFRITSKARCAPRTLNVWMKICIKLMSVTLIYGHTVTILRCHTCHWGFGF